MLSIGPGYAGADKRETSRDFASEPATMSSRTSNDVILNEVKDLALGKMSAGKDVS
jgi:hypothetical protein